MLALCARASADRAPQNAAELREKAYRLFSAGKYAQAINNYRSAYEIEPDVRLLYNLGLSHLYRFRIEQSREDLVQAHDLFRRFISLSLAIEDHQLRQDLEPLRKAAQVHVRKLARLLAQQPERVTDDPIADDSEAPLTGASDKPADVPKSPPNVRPSTSSVDAPAKTARSEHDPELPLRREPPAQPDRSSPDAFALTTAPSAREDHRAHRRRSLYRTAIGLAGIGVLTGGWALYSKSQARDLAAENRVDDANARGRRARWLGITTDLLFVASAVIAGVAWRLRDRDDRQTRIRNLNSEPASLMTFEF